MARVHIILLMLSGSEEMKYINGQTDTHFFICIVLHYLKRIELVYKPIGNEMKQVFIFFKTKIHFISKSKNCHE